MNRLTEWIEGWMDEWMDGWMDGGRRKEGRKGRTDKWIYVQCTMEREEWKLRDGKGGIENEE